jgi:hypothetical protein
MSGPSFLKPSTFSKGLPLCLAVMVLALAGCVSQAERDVPNWSGDYVEATPPQPHNGPQVYAPEPEVVAQTPLPALVSPTQNCTGTYFVRSAKTQALLEQGRALNAGSHFVVLGNRGRAPRTIRATREQSVTFLPDCGCIQNDQRASLPAPAACRN